MKVIFYKFNSVSSSSCKISKLSVTLLVVDLTETCGTSNISCDSVGWVDPLSCNLDVELSNVSSSYSSSSSSSVSSTSLSLLCNKYPHKKFKDHSGSLQVLRPSFVRWVFVQMFTLKSMSLSGWSTYILQFVKQRPKLVFSVLQSHGHETGL